MRFVSSQEDRIEENSNIEEIYNKLGILAESSKEKCFAKHTSKNIGGGKNQTKYYILTHNNVPYDPNGPDSHREAYLKMDMKSVSKQTFDYYIMYLKTRNSLYMTRAQRSYING